MTDPVWYRSGTWNMDDYKEAVLDRADVFLCTGSTITGAKRGGK